MYNIQANQRLDIRLIGTLTLFLFPDREILITRLHTACLLSCANLDGKLESDKRFCHLNTKTFCHRI